MGSKFGWRKAGDMHTRILNRLLKREDVVSALWGGPVAPNRKPLDLPADSGDDPRTHEDTKSVHPSKRR